MMLEYDDYTYEEYLRRVEHLEANLRVPVYFCVSTWGFQGYPCTLVYLDAVTGAVAPA